MPLKACRFESGLRYHVINKINSLRNNCLLYLHPTQHPAIDRQQQLKKQIDRLASRSFWFGVAVGLVLGILAGFAIGYSQGSPTTVVVPLSQGIKT